MGDFKLCLQSYYRALTGAGRLPVARLGHRTARIAHDDLERVLAQSGLAVNRSWDGRNPGAAAGDGAAGGRAPQADWREIGPSEHFVQFYEADAFLLDALG